MQSAQNEQQQSYAWGVFYFVLSNVVGCLTQTLASFCYKRHPGLTVFQLLWYRAIVSLFLTIAYLNRNLKSEMFDKVNRQNIVPLSVRTA